jgi:hypothetical protein
MSMGERHGHVGRVGEEGEIIGRRNLRLSEN